MQQENGPRITRPFIQIVNPVAVNLGIMRRKRKLRKLVESFVRSAKDARSHPSYVVTDSEDQLHTQLRLPRITQPASDRAIEVEQQARDFRLLQIPAVR